MSKIEWTCKECHCLVDGVEDAKGREANTDMVRILEAMHPEVTDDVYVCAECGQVREREQQPREYPR